MKHKVTIDILLFVFIFFSNLYSSLDSELHYFDESHYFNKTRAYKINKRYNENIKLIKSTGRLVFFEDNRHDEFQKLFGIESYNFYPEEFIFDNFNIIINGRKIDIFFKNSKKLEIIKKKLDIINKKMFLSNFTITDSFINDGNSNFDNPEKKSENSEYIIYISNNFNHYINLEKHEKRKTKIENMNLKSEVDKISKFAEYLDIEKLSETEIKVQMKNYKFGDGYDVYLYSLDEDIIRLISLLEELKK